LPEGGLVFACAGGGGHPERGGPKPAPSALKAAVRRAHRLSGVAGQVRLSFTDGPGPCGEAKVVFLYLPGRPWWFRRMNSPELFADLLAHAREALEGRNPLLPPPLAERSFSWAGGGTGPEPPVEPETSA
jgi:hypothetical protein